jgi:hypothetical protein
LRLINFEPANIYKLQLQQLEKLIDMKRETFEKIIFEENRGRLKKTGNRQFLIFRNSKLCAINLGHFSKHLALIIVTAES